MGMTIAAASVVAALVGYPDFAMILFLLAGAGATCLAVQILRHDRSVHLQ